MEAAATELEPQLFALSDHLAESISRRDAEGAARGVREDEHVVYISDGVVIRGSEYRDVLGRFYSTMRGIDFQWQKREVVPINNAAGVVTGWATISLLDASGLVAMDQALFTLVYRRTGLEWELVTAHKTTTK